MKIVVPKIPAKYKTYYIPKIGLVKVLTEEQLGGITVKYPRKLKKFSETISHEVEKFREEFKPRENLLYKASKNDNGDLVVKLRESGPINFLTNLFKKNNLTTINLKEHPLDNRPILNFLRQGTVDRDFMRFCGKFQASFSRLYLDLSIDKRIKPY